jgi:hypothetical protein
MSTKEERVTATVITSDLKITGNVETTNKLLIEGEVLGEVRGSTVVIDKKGRVTGGIVAEEVVVSGVVLGSIQGKRVHLQYTSHLRATFFMHLCSSRRGHPSRVNCIVLCARPAVRRPFLSSRPLVLEGLRH